MNWDALSAVTGIIALLLTLFVEWSRIKVRWRESTIAFSPTQPLLERFIAFSGNAIGVGVLLILSSLIWPYEYLLLSGRLVFTLGCFCLGLFITWEIRLKIGQNSDKSPSFHNPFIVKLFRFVGIYLILFGIVAGILAIWELILYSQ